MRTGALHHVGKQPFVFQDGAGLEQAVVEGLAFVILHEQRGAQRVEKACFPNVDVRVMCEHARLHIACGVDVQVAAPAGDAAADILGVVLEIHDEHRLARLAVSHAAQPFIHMNPLLGRGDKLRHGVVADRHIVEVKAEAHAVLDHKVDEFVARDGGDILARVADRDAEKQAVFPEQLHCRHGSCVCALAAAVVVALLGALNAQR